MTTIRDKLWLWGQTPGTHHNAPNGQSLYNCPGKNRMTPLEGAVYFGIPNLCRVVCLGQPEPPFDQEMLPLDSLDRVVWSIIGDSGTSRNTEGQDDVSEVLRLARKFPNITGGIMDDFMNPERMAVYTPAVLHRFAERLHTEINRRLELWTVIYTHELKDEAIPYLNECDGASLWTWRAKDLLRLDENFRRMREIYGPEKKLLAGCYLWDYGDKMPLPLDLMELQLETYRAWLRTGAIDGVILCSNCVADIDLKTVDFTRAWIREHGKEEID